MPEQLQKVLTQFGINESFFYVLGIVIGSYVLFRLLALSKIATIIIEREKRTEGRQDAAAGSKEELVSLKQNFDEKIKSIRMANAQILENKKIAAIEQQKEILRLAKEDGAKKVKESRANVEASLKAEVAKIEKEIPEIAKLIVQKFVSNKNTSALNEKSTGA